MANVLAEADFIEVDLTYKVSTEFPYMVNVVTFCYITMQCEFKSVI